MGWAKFRRSAPSGSSIERQVVAGQRLRWTICAHVEGEALERRQAAGLRMEVRKIEAPAVRLTAAMLAHETIQPALKSARQVEIGAIDGEHEGVIEDAGIEPVGQDQFDAERPAVASSRSFHSLIQEKRCRRRSAGWRIDVDDSGRLQPVERRLQPVIVARGLVPRPTNVNIS